MWNFSSFMKFIEASPAAPPPDALVDVVAVVVPELELPLLTTAADDDDRALSVPDSFVDNFCRLVDSAVALSPESFSEGRFYIQKSNNKRIEKSINNHLFNCF